MTRACSDKGALVGGNASEAAAAASTASTAATSRACVGGLCGGTSASSRGCEGLAMTAGGGSDWSAVRAAVTAVWAAAASAAAVAAATSSPHGGVEVAAELLGVVLLEGGAGLRVVQRVGQGVDGGVGDVDAGRGALGGHDGERVDALLDEGEAAVGVVTKAREERVAARHSTLMEDLNLVRLEGGDGVEDLELFLLGRGELQVGLVEEGEELGRADLSRRRSWVVVDGDGVVGGDVARAWVFALRHGLAIWVFENRVFRNSSTRRGRSESAEEGLSKKSGQVGGSSGSGSGCGSALCVTTGTLILVRSWRSGCGWICDSVRHVRNNAQKGGCLFVGSKVATGLRRRCLKNMSEKNRRAI